MPNAYQLPYSQEPSTRIGRKLFRKHLLPLGTIHYDDGSGKGPRLIPFTREKLARMAANFRAGATKGVPFVLANDKNEHNWDPERFRGEIKGLELTDSGLYGTIEMSDDGAKLLDDNPNLGVSAQVLEEPLPRADDGKTFSDVLTHVLGTLNPKLTKLGDWQPVSLATENTVVIDLTAAQFSETKEGEMPEITEEDLAFLRKMREQAKEPTDEEKAKAEAEAKAKAEAEGIHEPTEEEIAAAIEEADRAEKETVGAGLSQEAQQALDLANAAAEANRVELSGLRTELATEKWRAEAKTLVHQGVPPVDIELAAKALDPSTGTIDLSATDAVVQLQRKLDEAHNVIREQLARRKGTVDLSGEIGTVLEGDPTNTTTGARAIADKLAEMDKR